MSAAYFPYAVRPIGFSGTEVAMLDEAFAAPEGKGYGYFVLAEDNLQDPDLYVAKAADPDSLAVLAALRPSALRPALLFGTPPPGVAYAHVPVPTRRAILIDALDTLVEKRADALARLQASDVVLVPERRRRPRTASNGTDADYEKMRVKRPADGMILILDKTPALRDYLRDLLGRYRLRIEWAADEEGAAAMCKSFPTAIVLVNTSTPGVDPYRVCWAVKDKAAKEVTAVVFLISKPFSWNAEQARYVGADGFLNKPLASHHLVSVLKKFVPKLY